MDVPISGIALSADPKKVKGKYYIPVNIPREWREAHPEIAALLPITNCGRLWVDCEAFMEGN